MRLLDVSTLKPHRFMGDEIPPYAILSHAWGKDEVEFQDISKTPEQLAGLAGFSKIQNCCYQAAAAGLQYAWIDTCCINSDSSAELSEAINSMYEWYRAAEVCYAYMSDVGSGGTGFSDSRWFTRGWTLQELLAPEKMIFFDREWNRIGSKIDLRQSLIAAAGIQDKHLDYPEEASVAQRMSWISRRKTTRKEDIAYCLLGLFDVNMPLLYGEGERKAFLRLQQEIIKISSDETIFAWTDSTCWSSGMLAHSPTNFSNSGDIVVRRADKAYFRAPYTMTNLGLEVELGAFLRNRTAWYKHLEDLIAPLACGRATDTEFLALRFKIVRRISKVYSRSTMVEDKSAVVTMRTHLDEFQGYPGPLVSRLQGFEGDNGQRIFVPDVVQQKEQTALQLTAQDRGRPPQSSQHKQLWEKQPPRFVFSITTKHSPRLYHVKPYHTNKEQVFNQSSTITADSIDDFEEASSAVVCVYKKDAVAVALQWHFAPAKDEPSISLNGIKWIENYPNTDLDWRTSNDDDKLGVLAPGDIQCAPLLRGCSLWSSMCRAEGQDNTWDVDLDLISDNAMDTLRQN